MNFTNTSITSCIIHQVGNKQREEQINLSKKKLVCDEKDEMELIDFFSKQFRNTWGVNSFYHSIDLKMNEIYACSRVIFEGGDFVKTSQDIAQHLFDQTNHHAIKSGELFVVLFDEIENEGVFSRGIGLFKSERKDTYFRISGDHEEIEFDVNSGINKQKLDKGCIVLEDDIGKGFKVFSYEYNGADTEYWRNDFLNIKQRDDSFKKTEDYLSLCKNYVLEELPKYFEVSKAEQIDLVNRSVEYFKKNEEFNNQDFKETIFEDGEVINSFSQFESSEFDDYENNMERFKVSQNAVKRQKKAFKSVLKLDKNFHVYIHGNRELIEKGYDDTKKKNFYKIYFDLEL